MQISGCINWKQTHFNHEYFQKQTQNGWQVDSLLQELIVSQTKMISKDKDVRDNELKIWTKNM
jgi:hypothetical protein